MQKWKLYNVARQYIKVIEAMEKTRDPQSLADLEEQRVIWHNSLLRVLKQQGILFKDRDEATRWAYHILRQME